VYEKHVELAAVGQAAAIRETLAAAVRRRRPGSLLYLGCAGGNGLEGLPAMRVVGLDLNAQYIEEAQRRYPGGEFVACDLNDGWPHVEAVEMVFGALVLEYLRDLPAALRKAHAALAAGGRFIAPLLQAGEGVPAVLPSPYLDQLAPLGDEYRTVEPEAFVAEAAGAGFTLEARSERPLPSGKRFVVLELRKA
jgi:SAM-dependent methyltransferase